MTPEADPTTDSDELPPAEAARARRRDHDAAAAERSGMRTGLAKQFKQVLDAQVKRGRAAGTRTESPSRSRRVARAGRARHRRAQARRGVPPSDRRCRTSSSGPRTTSLAARHRRRRP